MKNPFKSLFSKKAMPETNSQQASTLASTAPVQPNAIHSALQHMITLTSAVPELIMLTTQLQSLATLPEVTSIHLDPILKQIELLIAQNENTLKIKQEEFNSSTNSSSLSSPLENIKKLAEKFSTLSLENEPVTYDTFLTHFFTANLKECIDYCKSLIVNPELVPPELVSSLDSYIQSFSEADSNLDSFKAVYEQFKQKEDALKAKINGFTQKLEQLQQQNQVEANMEVLTQARDQLDAERQAYLDDEAKMDNAIGQLTSTLPNLYSQIKVLSETVLEMINQVSPPSTNEAATASSPEILALTNLINLLKQIQLTLNTFK